MSKQKVTGNVTGIMSPVAFLFTLGCALPAWSSENFPALVALYGLNHQVQTCAKNGFFVSPEDARAISQLFEERLAQSESGLEEVQLMFEMQSAAYGTSVSGSQRECAGAKFYLAPMLQQILLAPQGSQAPQPPQVQAPQAQAPNNEDLDR